MAWLHCSYCHTTDHAQLGSLVPEAQGETRKVDICTACKAYLKAVTTLHAWPASLVLLEDLDTVDLDVAALEHGYARPNRPGRVLRTHIVAPAAHKRGLRTWRLGRR
jgi:FdhE protein